jgi:hypothetical protein
MLFENVKEIGIQLSNGINRVDLFEGMKVLLGKEKVKYAK